jgi:hypothetical protein
MSRFHLEISESDRFALVVSLSLRIADLEAAEPLAGYLEHLDLMRRLLEAPKLPEGQASAPKPQPVGIPAAEFAQAPAPTTPEPPAPERYTPKEPTGEITITLVSAELSADKKALVTTCKTRTGNGVKTNTLRCWDPEQWERIQASVGKSTTFLTRESKGFTNIVGVKA